MFKKILVPLDGSDLAAQILPQVETLAKQFKAQVTLLAVGSSDTCAGGGAPVSTIKEGAACPENPVSQISGANHRQAPDPGRGSDLGL